MNKNKKDKILKKTINNDNEVFSAEFADEHAKYGEFICSYFAWVLPDEQKKKVNRLENITKK